jgi:hypothetical protein
MSKLSLILGSRTFWTVVVIFVLNGFNGIHGMIPAGWVLPLDTVLGLLAVYFKVNPSQNYQ